MLGNGFLRDTEHDEELRLLGFRTTNIKKSKDKEIDFQNCLRLSVSFKYQANYSLPLFVPMSPYVI